MVPVECATVRAWEIAARLLDRAATRIANAAKVAGDRCPRDVRDIVAELDELSTELFLRADGASTLFPMPQRPRRGHPDEC